MVRNWQVRGRELSRGQGEGAGAGGPCGAGAGFDDGRDLTRRRACPRWHIAPAPSTPPVTLDPASWARDHGKIENSVHWIRDVVFGEDARKIRTRNAPAVVATLGDIVRGTLRAVGWINTASARRAHTDPAAILTLHGIT